MYLWLYVWLCRFEMMICGMYVWLYMWLYRFEKMISGMYMGELVRLVLCELVSNGLLFGGEASDELFMPNLFLTKYISEIER